MLVRDVTELRRRERELLTKDATIREIHHRVKNNLQTVAALLRLQARRLDVPEGRSALEEAVRRVGSIALVHELLSTAPEEVGALRRGRGPGARDGRRALRGRHGSGERGRRRSAAGRSGRSAREVATPLAVVLSELVQNAVEHGLDRGPGLLEVRAGREDGVLRVEVLDDGAGLPAGFDLTTSDRLGLQIVRTLVEGELGGHLAAGPARGRRHASRPSRSRSRRDPRARTA